MAKLIGADCRQCRREGCKLFLKGERCTSKKCAFERRPSLPGQHGSARKRVTEYGLQLREKQKVKRAYGILEKQFRRYYEEAVRMKGITGENMLSLIERRLDNVVYRMGLASSRKEARQLVGHGHFLLNGHKADIASMTVKPGDVITVKERSKSSAKFKALVEANTKVAPKWLETNLEEMSAKVVALPAREDIDLEIAEHLIIELYSK